MLWPGVEGKPHSPAVMAGLGGRRLVRRASNQRDGRELRRLHVGPATPTTSGSDVGGQTPALRLDARRRCRPSSPSRRTPTSTVASRGSREVGWIAPIDVRRRRLPAGAEQGGAGRGRQQRSTEGRARGGGARLQPAEQPLSRRPARSPARPASTRRTAPTSRLGSRLRRAGLRAARAGAVLAGLLRLLVQPASHRVRRADRFRRARATTPACSRTPSSAALSLRTVVHTCGCRSRSRSLIALALAVWIHRLRAAHGFVVQMIVIVPWIISDGGGDPAVPLGVRQRHRPRRRTAPISSASIEFQPLEHRRPARWRC